MTDTNKVEFGLSEIHVGTYTVNGGVVTMGTPYKLPGAVSMSLEPEGDENKFYADDTTYWSNYQDNGFKGTLEMARFTDAFKTQFLGYATLADGGIAAVKGAEKPKVYVCFQGKGDAQKRRCILYNVTLGQIKTEKKTIEDKTEPGTQSIDITVDGDVATGLTKVEYSEDASGYSTLFTNPPAPAVPAGHSWTAVTPEEGANPHNEGWYTRHGSSPNYRYWLTDDETVQTGTTYYKYV